MNEKLTYLLRAAPGRNRKAREWFSRSITYTTSWTGLTMLVVSAAVAVSLFATLHTFTPTLSFPQILLQGRFGSEDGQSYAKLPVLLSWPSSSVYVKFR